MMMNPRMQCAIDMHLMLASTDNELLMLASMDNEYLLLAQR